MSYRIMNSKRIVSYPRRPPGGFSLLMLLVAIGIGLVIYMLSLQRLGPALDVLKKEKHPEGYPWDELWRLEQQHRQGVRDMKLDIYSEFHMRLKVQEIAGSRGEIELTITPAGEVWGAWSGTFYRTVEDPDEGNYEVELQIMSAQLEGIIDPDKKYTDETRRTDSELLYLITRGEFSMTETDLQTNQVRQTTGPFMVVGWLRPDNTAFGTLHLTTRDGGQLAFDWMGREETLR